MKWLPGTSTITDDAWDSVVAYIRRIRRSGDMGDMFLECPMEPLWPIEDQIVCDGDGVHFVYVTVDGKDTYDAVEKCRETSLKEISAKYPDAKTIVVAEMGPMFTYQYIFHHESGWAYVGATEGYA